MPKKSSSRTIEKVKLTDHQKEVLAAGVDSEFFKLIRDVILPQRRVQLSLTAIEADQTMEEIWYHRGMIRMCKWLPDWIKGETQNIDITDYSNDEEVSATDDNSV